MKNIYITGINGSAGRIHIGHYLGVLKPFVNLQKNKKKEDTLIAFIADLHGLTNPYVDVRGNSENLLLSLIASGFDFKKTLIFNQSDVSSHCELMWVLACQTTIGQLERMTQYKEKSQKFIMANGTNTIPTGIFLYPTLMSSDILLYNANFVPCGYDQVQHVELARDIAEKFNKKYGQTFILPKAIIEEKESKKIYSLNKPFEKKMSKSEPEGCLWMLDNNEEIEKKIKKALTDNLNIVHFDKSNQPGISNLMSIYQGITGLSYEQIEKKYKNSANYKEFKLDLISLLQKVCGKWRRKYFMWEKKKNMLKQILKKNAIKAKKIGDKKVQEVYKIIGIKK